MPIPASPIKFRQKVLYLSIEAAYGTPETILATHAIETENVECTPLQLEEVTKTVDKPGFGSDEIDGHSAHQLVSFNHYFPGKAAVDTVPAWGPIMRMCGFSQNVVATTSVDYTPVSTGFESATGEFDQSNTAVYVMPGLRAKTTLTFEYGQYLKPSVNGMSLYTADTDTVSLLSTLTAWLTT